jgi:hypothetical protein
MPYFNNDTINLLFIHIPKTGGESVQTYLSETHNITLNNESLYWFMPESTKTDNNMDIQSSLQHLPGQTILNYKEYFKINMTNLKILTIVRNPYNRIISDLFWFKLINIDNSKDEVYSIINQYLSNPPSTLDNHNVPQHLFLTDTNNNLINNITIMRTETLTEDMIKLGYTDFNTKINCNPYSISCWDYLNSQSIQLINSFYETDFKMFNYEVINEC